MDSEDTDQPGHSEDKDQPEHLISVFTVRMKKAYSECTAKTMIRLDECDSFVSYYSQTCVKRPYKKDIFLAFQAGGCLLQELSALLSVISTEPPVYSDFHVT